MSNRKKTTLGVVHVTATPPGWNKGVAGIRAMHKAMGWSDIGYNEIINPDGKAEIGRGKLAIGAHVAGFNSISYGISMVGGVNGQGKGDFSTLSKAQLETLERRMRELTKEFPAIKWCGHRDLSPDKNGNGIIEPHEWLKECPTFDVIPWAQSKGLPVADIKGKWGKTIVLVPNTGPVTQGPDTRDAYLQRLLDRAGYKLGPIDGIVGPMTKTAIKAFQAAEKLTQSGTFDDSTVKRLRAKFEAPVAVSAQPAGFAGLTLPGGGVPQIAPVLSPAVASDAVKQGFLGSIITGVAADVLKDVIGGVLTKASKDPDLPVTRDSVPDLVDKIVDAAVPAVIDQISPKVQKEIDAVVQNQTNQEAWYQSRVILGTIVSIAALGIGFLGVQLDAAQQGEIVDNVTKLIAAGSALYALYGRVRSDLKPLGK